MRVHARGFRHAWVTAAAILTVTLSTTAAEAQGWYGPAWQHRKAITILGSQVTGVHNDFPLLLSFTDADLSAARGDGWDILFTDEDGVLQLPHEIEFFNRPTGELIVWVSIPLLEAGVDKTIFLYYGHPSSPDQQNPAGVWDAGYQGVWHLYEPLPAPMHLDSTSYSHDGTRNENIEVAGQIYDGQDFDGLNDSIRLGNNTIIDPTQPFTISAWVWVDQTPPAFTQYTVYSRRETAPVNNGAFSFVIGDADGGDTYLNVTTFNAGWITHTSDSQVPIQTWTHVAVACDGANVEFTINGSNDGSAAYTSPIGAANLPQYVGESYTGFRNFFGSIDELRVSGINRPFDWIETSFNNQLVPGSFIQSVGSQESAPFSWAEAEIDPNGVATDSGSHTFTYDIYASIQPPDTGVDQILIRVPLSFGLPTVTTVEVNGGPVGYSNNTVGRMIDVVLGSKVMVTSRLQVVFSADAPVCPAPQGMDFTSALNDQGSGLPPIPTVEGDGNQDGGGDGDDWTVLVNGPGAPSCYTKIYWADYINDRIQRADLDGSNVENLVATGAEPRDIALDHVAGKMYWTDIVANTIQRANLDGTDVEDLVTGLVDPHGIALDGPAGKMYWTDLSSDRIQRANLDGSAIEDLRITPSPQSIALDRPEGKMYWTDTNDRIRRANLDGTGEEVLVAGLNLPMDMALDLRVDKMYWVDEGEDKIQRAELDGTAVEDVVTELPTAHGIALDLDRAQMYWSDWATGRIQRASLDGDHMEDVVTLGGGAAPYGIALGYDGPPPNAVMSAVAEIEPNDVPSGAPGTTFTYDILTTIGATETGVDRVTITVPSAFGTPTISEVNVGGLPAGYTNNTVGNEIRIDLDNKVLQPGDIIQVVFNSDTPSCRASSAAFVSTVDDSTIPSAPQSTTEGDADGDGGDANSWAVSVAGDPCWYDGAWQSRMRLCLDGAQFAGDLNNFPVLISITDTALRTPFTRADGWDLLFTDDDGATVLHYERESFDNGTGTLVAWVNVPVLFAGIDKELYLYYNYPGVPADQQNASGVWDSNYAGVWHLEESPADGVPGHLDSTVPAQDGTPWGFADGGGGSTSAPGIMAGADTFANDSSGEDNRVEVPNDPSLIPPGDMTVEAWIHLTNPATADTVLNLLDGAGFSYQMVIGTSDEAVFVWSDSANTPTTAYGTSPLLSDTWYHVVGIRRGTDIEIHVDGTQEGSTGGAVGATNPSSDPLVIGAVDSGDGGLGGRIDEVRVSDVARSPEWIQTSYNNQSDPGSFIKCTDTGMVAASSAVAEIAPNDVVTASGLNSFIYDILLGFDAGDTGVDRVTITVPRNFGPPTVTGLSVGGFLLTSGTDYLTTVSGRLITIDLTAPLTSSTNIQVLFDAWAPICADVDGHAFTSTVDDSTSPEPPQVTIQGNADGDSSDANTWTVTTTGADGSQCFTKMYWSDRGTGMIQRANLDGTAVEDLVNGLSEPGGIALDHGASKMYWTDRTDMKIQRANLDGTDVEDLVIAGLTGPRGIALDTAAGKMYWADTGVITRANLDGTGVENVVSSLSGPAGITLDLTGSKKIYWTDWMSYTIQRANIDGSGVEDLVTSGISEPWGIALDLSEGKMYWTEATGTRIQRANFDGTGVEELLAPGAAVKGMTLDLNRGRMYFTVLNPSVWSAELDGSHTEIPVSGLSDPVEIEMGFDIGPTAVNLTAFTATGLDGEVLLEWQTASESNNFGFILYRSEALEGPFERVTAEPIPGLGSSSVGARYHTVDSGLTNGRTYFYLLEDIEFSGRTEQHGPVAATPEEGASAGTVEEPSAETTEEPSSAPSSITYGDPSDVEFRILSRGPQGVVVELTTGGFYAEPRDDGTVRLSVPGFVEESAPGTTAIPVRRAWIEALAGRKVRIVSVQAADMETFTGLRPMAAEAPEIQVSPWGTVQAGSRRAPGRSRIRRGEMMVPQKAARLLDVGFQGEAKKALVELAPLRWNVKKEELSLARRLEVHFVFYGRVAEEWSLGGSRGLRSPGRRGPTSRGVVARLALREKGLYGVRFEDIFGRRRRGVPESSIRLSRQGESVAFHIEPANRRFGPGSVLTFVSEGASLSPYAKEVVLELEIGREGLTMPVVPASPSGPATDLYWPELVREDNTMYTSTFVEIPQSHHWNWSAIYNSARKSFSFETSLLAPSVEPGELTLSVTGVSLESVATEHRLRLFINGALIAEPTLENMQPERLSVECWPGLLREGVNELAVENVTEAFSAVLLDRFTLSYPRTPVAEHGVLEGRWSKSGLAEVAGISGPAYVVDVTEEPPLWLSDVESRGALRFRAEAGRRYVAYSAAAVLTPDVRKASRSSLRNSSNQADYLMVGPGVLLDAVAPLLELRRAQGLRSLAVPIEEVYDAFGYGEEQPQAIRDFLVHAFHNWQAPAPRYVLLVGDASYDTKDYLATGTENQVPTQVIKTTYMWTASDPAYAAVNGEDLLPDLAIGRLPASTAAEARMMAEKIISYETGEQNLNGTVVLVADNSDGSGNYEGSMETLASTILASHELSKIYLARLGPQATRLAIADGFDQGASLVSYVGHGGTRQWAHENIFNTAQVEDLAPQPEQPVVLTMNCYNGYFHNPHYDSLAEELMRTEEKGAIAAFSPSGLSQSYAAHWLHEALLQAILNESHPRLGDAILAAQEAYAATGAFPELLSIFHLFGDPAMSLRK